MKPIFKDKDTNAKFESYALAGCAVVLFYFILAKIDFINAFFTKLLNVLAPFIWGVGFAYIMWLTADWMERTFLKNLNYRKKRIISSFLALFFFILVVVIFFMVMIPQLIKSITQLTQLITDNSSNIAAFFASIAEKMTVSDEIYNYLITLANSSLQNIATFVKDQVPIVFSSLFSSIKWVTNLIIGLIISLYILLDRDHLLNQCRNIARAYLNEDHYKYLAKVMHLTNDMIGNFISGKLWDSLIIGLICFALMSILKMDYSLLISFIVGITNIIPFFGPFIGAIPSALILLIVSPVQCLTFVIMILILQQIDGNIIGPKILGDSVGLSSLWIMFAILIGSGYFGITGMILGVPIFAVFYFLFKEHIYNRLEEKGLKPTLDKNDEIVK